MKTELSTPLKSQLRVLLVEDDAATRESACIKLEKEGFLVHPVEDGAIAFETLQKDTQFDAVLLDIRMPKSDGFEFLEKKQTEPSCKDIPVVIFTNLNQPEYVERALALGAKSYLVKAHHSIQEIANELKNCLVGGLCIIDR